MGDVEVRALRGVTLDIDAGRVRGDHGPVGLGQVHADEHPRLPRPPDQRPLPARRRATCRALDARRAGRACATGSIGFVFQSFNLLPRTTRARERGAAAALRRASPPRERQRARDARRSSGSASATGCDHHPNQLSGGQQQRVAIARALVDRARAHPRRRAHRQPRLAHQRRDHGAASSELSGAGITIVLVTHEPDIAALRAPRDRRARRPGRRTTVRRRSGAAGATPMREETPHEPRSRRFASRCARCCATRCAPSSPCSASSSASAP